MALGAALFLTVVRSSLPQFKNSQFVMLDQNQRRSSSSSDEKMFMREFCLELGSDTNWTTVPLGRLQLKKSTQNPP
ncbi:hypothetical protein ILYODFUR_015234 [Ilyodon furcidens]|uniref:Uncharacterized protein n=1 Tax=Ilyodon furcidens TaxID=33524 RepID=A0ABV0V5L7_9TELE